MPYSGSYLVTAVSGSDMRKRGFARARRATQEYYTMLRPAGIHSCLVETTSGSAVSKHLPNVRGVCN